ncbi:hypothetical protein CXB72_06010 [Lactobacillus acidophilus]|uniref:Abi family protein n=1 Tax=Lactobacillus acidophilus TaxID=1579 RepID=UPI000F755479|nr:Abi family protein [Lactobacillus acidophilus]AZN76692.1 hypothetical protein CXB72_06010 [Lactobacillus acidophilus]
MEDYLSKLPYPYKRLLAMEIGLKKQGLIIDSNQEFEDFVGTYGYENTILKYQNEFLVNPFNGKSDFIEGTKFSDIKNLFLFDAKLRKELFSIMQFFELTLKSAMINTVAFSISEEYSGYIKSENFKERYSLKGEGGKEYDETTRKWLRKRIKEYNNKANQDLLIYDLIPKMYFHEVEDWYFLLNNDLKEKAASYIAFGPLAEMAKFKDDQNPIFYVDPMIQLYRGFRDQAAHEGVIYNYYDPRISWPHAGAYFDGREIIPNTPRGHCSVGLLLLHSYFLTNKNLFHRFDDTLYDLVNEYISHNYHRINIMYEMGLDRFKGIDDRFDELIKSNS